MEGFDANVGAIDTVLQQRPEVLKAVGVDAAVDLLDSVIHDFGGVVAGEPFVGEQEVGIERRSRFDVLADFSLQDRLATALDNYGADLATTLKDAHDRNLVFGAGAGDSPLTNTKVHVASLAANEGLIGFDLRSTLTAQLHQGTTLHGETNAMEHEPSGGLSDAKATCEFAGRNAILAIGDDPHGRKPLLKSKGGILKDGSDLRGELTFSVSTLALPLLLVRKPRYIAPSAGGTGDAIRPNFLNHVGDALIGIGKVDYCFSESGRAAHVSRIGVLS